MRMNRAMIRGALLLGLALTTSRDAAAGLINGSFEIPRFTPGVPDFALFDASMVTGWQTTATNNVIELWSDGFSNVSGGPVFAYEGDQHAELNATEVSTLFQDASGIPLGSLVGFQFAHRGRSGVDTLRLTITDLGSDNAPGGLLTAVDTVLFTNLYSDGNTAWGFYTNPTPLAALGNTVRFAYESVSAAGGNQAIGNFIDAADFGVGVGAAVPEPSTLASAGIAGLIGLGAAWRRRKRAAA
jgi:hypothetical protein